MDHDGTVRRPLARRLSRALAEAAADPAALVIVSGAELVFEATRLGDRMRNADLCITAEGRFDGQSLQGKAPFAVAKVAKQVNVPCVVLAGSLGDQK